MRSKRAKFIAAIVGIILLCGCTQREQSSSFDGGESEAALSQADIIGSWEAIDEGPSIYTTGLLQMRFTNDGVFDFLSRLGADEGYDMIIHGSYTFDGESIHYEAINFQKPAKESQA